ncbi:transporter [Aquibium microcysteis]|uniref:transporter n=1 Tax=Aquibium microcysteis TaxID=675281 RepID=UPI00165D12AF|nr:transporter [Aquibium microcysteis]
MPSAEQIHVQLTGAWRMMLGRADGLRMLDLSADGFWTSFFAIVVALPALFAGWVSIANGMAALDPDGPGRLSLILRLAVIDLSSWILPLVALALAARRAGIGDRYVPYVVASNWATAIVVWIMLPPSILRLAMPDAADLSALVSLGLFFLTLVFSWRLTNIAIGKGAAVATGVFAAMVGMSLFVLFGMQDLLGLAG